MAKRINATIDKETKQLLINDFGYQPVDLESYTGQLRALKETFNSLQIQNPKDARLRQLAIATKNLRADKEVEKDDTGTLKRNRKRRKDAKSLEQIQAEIDAKDKAIADRKAKKKKDAMNFISPGSAPAALPPAEGADGGAMDRSIPMEKMMDDAMICWAQNGERLRPEQGYPIRLLVPGLEGNMNIKWIRRLKVGTAPWMTREETSKYTDLMDDGTARQFTFVQETNSCITYPSAGQQMSHKGFHEITGLAWSGRGKIKQVDVSVDGGRNWKTANLQETVMSKCLTRFRIPWQWKGEKAQLQSRAIDETGYVQPTLAQLRKVRGVNSIYHKNSIYTWEIDTNGGIKNVQLG